MESSRNRLVKNTLLLYLRTIITLLVSLFTSRVILHSLGVDDFGLYNVIGGFVALFSVVSSSLTATTQRFLTYEIGKEKDSNVCKVFNISMSIHIYLAFILFVLLELIGVPLLNSILNIETNRLYAANWVFQFSVFSFVINILSIPFTALVIANEKMNVFAYISLLSSILKLIVAYLIYVSPIDKLILYALLLFLVALLERFIYSCYSRKSFSLIHFKLIRDRREFADIFQFAGMNFIGAFASILCNQGINVLLNIFFGVVVNAARAIAVQIQGAVERFTSDFMTALNPQITKEYASGNIEKSISLSLLGSKFSFFLMLLMSSVFIIRTDYVLNLWLGTVPEYTVEFVRLTICISLLNMLSNPIVTIILANGNLRSFTFWIGGIRLLMLPAVYVALLMGGSPHTAYSIVILFEIFALVVRMIIVNKMVGRSYFRSFLNKVLSRSIAVFFIVVSILFYIDYFFCYSFVGFILSAITNVIISILIILLIGITKTERTYILKLLINKFNFLNKRL